ncbi:MAG: monovalent cation:H+ antiporter-2, family [Hyphomicrobiales bacterium]|jgi:CPA2 family monovalent cation:H+ antiporter-2|nr:monovalent cation:H+ antiporter-2, family [Hyphomicrobiales bacterium]
MDPHAFLQNLAVVLCVAAVATVVFQRLHQPVVFGYLLAGMIIGPHIPIPLVADPQTVRALSELGVILLMFSLGLEFSIRKLVQVSQKAGAVALFECSVMISIGYLVGQMLGLTRMESIFAGAIVGISSTTIIVKAFQEQKVKGRVTELVFGILIIEDLIAIFLLTILTTISRSGAVSPTDVLVTAMRLAMFLAALIGFGILIVPRAIRAVQTLGQPETTLVASIGICFAAALLALSFGYSVALGAFIAGSLVAESGHETEIEKLVRPVRDMFAAIFFVSVGMMIDPAALTEHWRAVVVLTLAVIVGKVLAVTIGSFLAGHGRRTAMKAGMSLAQIGEFSFIIASVGVAAGAISSWMYPVAIAVSAITTLTTPLLIKLSNRAAASIDHWLPEPIQTVAALYGSWIERVRGAPRAPTERSGTNRIIRIILIDAALITAVVIGVDVELDRLSLLVGNMTGMPPARVRFMVVLVSAMITVPLIYGLITSARALGNHIARRAFADAQKGKVDPADAPRRALVIVVQIAVVLAVGIPVVAITQPFLPPHQGALVLTLLTLVLLVALWRNAANLQGHARAGAQIIASALAHQMASTDGVSDETKLLEDVNAVLPGLGEPVAIRVVPQSIAVGRSLGQLNLRGATGATVLAIRRGAKQIPTPLGREVIEADDLVAVAGSRDALAIARALFAPNLARIRDDLEGVEIEAELQALNDALLVERTRSRRSFLP